MCKLITSHVMSNPSGMLSEVVGTVRLEMVSIHIIHLFKGSHRVNKSMMLEIRKNPQTFIKNLQTYIENQQIYIENPQKFIEKVLRICTM